MAKTETLVDDFSTADSGKWDYATAGANATVTGGQLHLANGTQLFSVDPYDLTGSSLYFELVDPGSATPGEGSGVFFGDFEGLTGVILMGVDGGNLALVDLFSGPVGTPVTYNATDHRWLRLRESSGTVFVDASPDGESWTNAVISGSYAVGTTWSIILTGFGAIIDNFNTTGGGGAEADHTSFFQFFS